MLIVKLALENYRVHHVLLEKKRSVGGGHLKKALDDYDDVAVVHPNAKYSIKIKIEDLLTSVYGKNPDEGGSSEK
jgi:hypothetical protein